MLNRSSKSFATGSLLALMGLAILVPASRSSAAPMRPDYFNAWLAKYSNSDSGNNASCNLCHSLTGFDEWNGYGWSLRGEILGNGLTIDDALDVVEALNGDADPVGFANIVEIRSDAQPGWTPGASNTIYEAAGGTQPNQPPPIGIGDLDPGNLGTNYCTGNLNSAGGNGSMYASGDAIAANDSVTLYAMDVPPNKFGLFFYGPFQANQAFPGAQNNGQLCIVGGFQRIQPTLNTGPANGSGFGLAQAELSMLTNPVLGDITSLVPISMNFQFWHRDAMGTTNTSDGLEIAFQ